MFNLSTVERKTSFFSPCIKCQIVIEMLMAVGKVGAALVPETLTPIAFLIALPGKAAPPCSPSCLQSQSQLQTLGPFIRSGPGGDTRGVWGGCLKSVLLRSSGS